MGTREPRGLLLSLSLFISEEPISNLPQVIKEMNLILSTLLRVDTCPAWGTCCWHLQREETTPFLVRDWAKSICQEARKAAAPEF